MNFHKDEGPPCKNMENMLQQLADGTLKGTKRWFTIAHATHCDHCGTFLSRLKVTLEAAKASKNMEIEPETMSRLKAQIKDLENQHINK